MSDAPVAASAAPATDAPAGAPAPSPAPADAKAAKKPADAADKAPAKPADAKPWVNPHIARRAAQMAAPKPAAAVPSPSLPTPSPPVDPVKRLAEIETAHKATGEKLTRYEETLKARVAQDLAALPERVRKVIERDAAGDPLTTLRMITSAHEMGLTAQPIPTGATTAPAPPATSAAVDPDAATLAEYQSLKSRAPIRANAFRMLHGAAIARAESRRAS
jgi:hypothetical protein